MEARASSSSRTRRRSCARSCTACGRPWPASWGEHADYVDARGARAHRRMLELAAPGRATGCSSWRAGRGRSGSRRPSSSRPGGEVVLSDVAAEMTSIAAARARALGLATCSTRVLDLEQIDEPDGSYDVVLCREG